MLIASFRYFYCLSAQRAQIEVLQRHARFVDFLVKAAGGLVGIGSVRAYPIPLLGEIAGSALMRFLDRSVERRNHLADPRCHGSGSGLAFG
jgi:hypothetical protein